MALMRRVFTVLFAAPPDRDLDWQDTGIEGIQRFLGRVYRFFVRNAHPSIRSGANLCSASSVAGGARDPAQTSSDHQARERRLPGTLAFQHLHLGHYGVGERFVRARKMRLRSDAIPVPFLAEVQRNLVLLLAPFAPYLAHELWEMLGEKGSLLRAPWPKYDAALAKEEEIEIPVQVNGKLRSRVTVSVDASEAVVIERALADEKVKAAIAGKQIVKKIYVPGKMVNLVAK